MTIIELLIITLIAWSAIGSLIVVGIGMGTDFGLYSYGLQMFNPIYIYEHVQVNYFGTFLVTLFMNALCPIASFCYWFYKLCTVGRR